MKYGILYKYRDFLNQKCSSKKTADTYYSAVKNFFKDIQFSSLNEISEEFVINKIKSIRTKNKFSAAKNALKLLHEFDSSLTLPEEDIFKSMSIHKKNHTKSRGKKVDFETVKRKVNSCRNVRLKYAYRLAMISGLRISELDDLEPIDLTFEDGIISVYVRNGKGGRPGHVTCLEDPYLYTHLQEFIRNFTASDKVFYNESTMRKYAWEHGFETHDFRRAYAILLKKKCLAEGMDKYQANKIVMKGLRHARFSNTKRYLYGRKILIKNPYKKIIKSNFKL